MHKYRLTTTIVLLCIGAASAAPPETWPQWRGPLRTGIAPGADWPDRLTSEYLVESWKLTDLGPSYSGPIVTTDRVYITETVDKKVERVLCLNRHTGVKVWSQEWEGALTVPFFAARNGSWIRSTPAYDGSALYVAGMRDVLVCLDASDGKQRWRVDFAKEYSSPLPAFGFVSSPLVDDEGVYVQAGGCVSKLDKKTGKTLWKSLKEGDAMMGSAFSSPIFARLNGRDQLVVQTRTRLAGVEPATGDVLWEKAIPSFRGMNILTPVTTRDQVLTSTYGGSTRLIAPPSVSEGTPAVNDVWTLKYEGNMTSPIVIDGHAYVYGKDRRFLCVDLKTGKENWRTEQRFGEYWSLVGRKDRILALDSAGKLFLIRATPEKFDLLDERTISKAETWAHLAVAGDEVYVRDLNGLTAYRWSRPR